MPYITDLPWIVQSIFGTMLVGLALGLFSSVVNGRR